MKRFQKRIRTENGFSLVEVLTVLLLVSLIAAIAIPKYTAAMNRDKFTVAQTNGENIYREITDALSSASTLGTTNGTITYSAGTGLLTLALGTGATSPSPFSENIDPAVSLTGKTYANTMNWCIALVDDSAKVIYNQDGLQSSLNACP